MTYKKSFGIVQLYRNVRFAQIFIKKLQRCMEIETGHDFFFLPPQSIMQRKIILKTLMANASIVKLCLPLSSCVRAHVQILRINACI